MLPRHILGSLGRLAAEASTALGALILRRKRTTSLATAAMLDSGVLSVMEALDKGDAAAVAEATARVSGLGRPALDELVRRFPGRLSVTFPVDDSPLPPPAECGPLMRALLQFGRTVLPAIVPLLNSGDREVRLFATHLLSEVPYPEAMIQLAGRLTDPEPQVRRVAAEALRSFRDQEGYSEVLVDLMQELSGNEVEAFTLAAQALATMRSSGAVPPLIRRVADPSPGVSEAAQKALQILTLQSFGSDLARWRAWWKTNGHRTRMEWLMDGLVHAEIPIRIEAISELAEATGMTFGFHADAPDAERAAVRDRFLAWFMSSGPGTL